MGIDFKYNYEIYLPKFDSNYFFNSRINFEFPATGGILTEATFDTAKLLRYLSRKDYVVLGG